MSIPIRSAGVPLTDPVSPAKEGARARCEAPSTSLLDLTAGVFAALAVFFTGEATAQPGDYTPQPRMTLEAGGGECFAVVRIVDRPGIYNRTETLATDYGPVSITYTTIASHAEDDRFDVAELPPGVSAWPLDGYINQDAPGRVCLMLSVGA